MPEGDSIIDRERIAVARALLAPPVRSQNAWAPLGAAALLAIVALLFASVMIMAPPLVSQHVAHARDVP